MCLTLNLEPVLWRLKNKFYFGYSESNTESKQQAKKWVLKLTWLRSKIGNDKSNILLDLKSSGFPNECRFYGEYYFSKERKKT